MDASSFNPSSLFGIPLSLFPPGVPWSSKREVLYELMNDLHRGWVQDYMLRSDANVDARILSSPSQLTTSLSLTFSGHVDSTYAPEPAICFDGALLAVPAFARDGVCVGIAVERTYASDAPTKLSGGTNRFMHYVLNERTGTLCFISEGDEMGVMEMVVLLPSSQSNLLCMSLRFDSVLFAKAFFSGSVNFDLLECSMMNMLLAYCVLDSGAQSCMGRIHAANIDTEAPSFHAAERNFSIWDHLHLGEFLTKGVLSVYDNSVLMKAEPVFGLLARKRGANVKKFVVWGMADRLGRLKPIPPALISNPSERGNLLEVSYEVDDSDVRTSVRDVNIALFQDSRSLLDLLFSWTQGQEVSLDDKLTKHPQISGLPATHTYTPPSKHVSSTSHAQPNLDLPVAEIPLSSNSLPVHILRNVNSSRGVVRIAPAPTTPSNLSPKKNEQCGCNLEESREKERLAKINLRKIRKREAAFKSNEKRKERRRIACLSQK